MGHDLRDGGELEAMKSAWMKLSLLASWAAFASLGTVGTAVAAQDIRIDRAVNSPTITVRYTKFKAAMIELRVNGRSLATRELSPTAGGETNFTIDPDRLAEGSNDVEVLLFDADGKLLGTQKAVITAERDTLGSVFVELPSAGTTVRGPVEIRLGVNRDFREMYVSFFINDEWKSLRNFPPFTYIWDTTRVPNGWHEIQAWVVDEANTTHKTRKVRVFVNNPGGRTDRVAPVTPPATAPVTPPVTTPAKPPVRTPADVSPSGNPRQAPVSGDRGLRSMTPSAAPTATRPTPATVAPRRPAGLTTSGNPSGTGMVDTTVALRSMPVDGQPVVTRPATATARTPAARSLTTSAVRPPIAAPAGMKSTPTVTPTASGLRTLTPTGQRTVVAQAPRPAVPTLSAVKSTQQGTQTVLVTRGARIPNVGSLTVLVAGRIVEFDVAPRVEQGIPLAPVRHVLEQTGGQVGWNHATKTVNAQANGQAIQLRVGQSTATVGNQKVRLERPVFLEMGRTLIPMSFLSDGLGLNVQYDPATGQILITRKD